VIVLDTATWIWRASDPERLTTNARRAIDGRQIRRIVARPPRLVNVVTAG